MDYPCIQRNKSNMASDWPHDIQLIDHKPLDTDPYIYYLYKPLILDSQSSLHTRDDILRTDHRDILVNIYMNQLRYVLYRERLLHKDWGYMVHEFQAHVELGVEEFQLIPCHVR